MAKGKEDQANGIIGKIEKPKWQAGGLGSGKGKGATKGRNRT